MTEVGVAGIGFGTAESIPIFHVLSGGSVVRVIINAQVQPGVDLEGCDDFNDIVELYTASIEGQTLKNADSNSLIRIAKQWHANGVSLEGFDLSVLGDGLQDIIDDLRLQGLKVGIKTASLKHVYDVDFVSLDLFNHCSKGIEVSGLELDKYLGQAQRQGSWVEVSVYMRRAVPEEVIGEASITGSHGFPLHVHLIEHGGGGPVRELYSRLRSINPFVYIHVDLYDELNTYCPRCGSPIAYRDGAALKLLELNDDACWKCGYRLPFRYIISKKTSRQLLALSGGGVRWYDPRAVMLA